MKTLSIDIESFSSVNLTKSGVYRYAESDDFEVLLFGYSADSEPVHVVDLVGGEQIPADIMAALTDPNVTKWAFNAQFERVCLSRFLGLPTGEYIYPTSWRCTMVWAATLGLPLSLEGVGAVLGLEKQKLKEGKDLIRYFCTLGKDRDGAPVRHHPQDAPEKWALFKAYNLRDVETEMAIHQKLVKFPVPDSEWRNYHLDQQINDRGIMLDRILVCQAIRCDEQFKQAHLDVAREVTGLENPNSPTQLKAWLAEQGVEADSLSKAAVLALLEKAEGSVEKALSLRQELAKSSVKKFTAMENVVCRDHRARGLIQFYGANRTGRYAGRLIQVQNLPQNHLPDLDAARRLICDGQFDTVEMLYDSVPIALSELIRTAFIPRPGNRFFVADFSAIEARVIAGFAGETWRQEVFAAGGDIYCASASQMFHVPVEKHGVNGHLRQKGKIAELACIAEGSLVLTDRGLVPIEKVETHMRLWDGDSWVAHDGVVYNGVKEVIDYEGLRATSDHLVWIEGQSQPVPFEFAASCSAHLIQTGDGGRAIRMGQNHQPRKALEPKMEPLLRSDPVHRLWEHPVAGIQKSGDWKIEGLPAVFPDPKSTDLAGKTSGGREAALRESTRQRVFQIRSQGNSLQFSIRSRSRSMGLEQLPKRTTGVRTRSYRQQWQLRTGQPSFCLQANKSGKPETDNNSEFRPGGMAICAVCGHENAGKRNDARGNHFFSTVCCGTAPQELETYRSEARVYDIRDAGPQHRFTVSGRLVHNCGYGGGVGALKAMGALEMGVPESELSGLIQQWRTANPNIVRFWWAVDAAVKTCVKQHTPAVTHGIRFVYRSGILFIMLPSGRQLAYVKPRIGENRFGGESVTYEGVASMKKWDRIESYGPKFVENIVQATARDLLAEAMLRLDAVGYQIVMHVHDEVVIEAPEHSSLDSICDIMGEAPTWADGLLLRADGFICDFYKKD